MIHELVQVSCGLLDHNAFFSKKLKIQTCAQHLINSIIKVTSIGGDDDEKQKQVKKKNPMG